MQQERRNERLVKRICLLKAEKAMAQSALLTQPLFFPNAKKQWMVVQKSRIKNKALAQKSPVPT